jgi:membrane protease YdiL (CAAX protease family)
VTAQAEAPRRTDAFFGPHGVRAGWRVLLFGALLVTFTIPLLVAAQGRLDAMPAGFLATLLGGLLASAVMLRAVDRRPFGALGFALEPRAARDSAVGFGIGGGLLAAAVVLLVVAGTARWVADDGGVADYAASLARALVIFTVAAAAEEVIFRGYAFQALVQGTGAWPAILLTSAAFAAGHGSNPNVTWLGLANIFLAGIMLAVAYLRTRSLWFATGVHMGWNWAMSALLDFPVSGAQFDTPLYSARELGADWWTGGPFGPEAGLAATLAIVAGTAWMMRTPLLSASPGIRSLRPLVDTRLGDAWNGR